jgi:hypothetical protein
VQQGLLSTIKIKQAYYKIVLIIKLKNKNYENNKIYVKESESESGIAIFLKVPNLECLTYFSEAPIYKILAPKYFFSMIFLHIKL